LPSSTRGALPVRFVEADLDDMAGLDMIEVLEFRKLKLERRQCRAICMTGKNDIAKNTCT
jgi:hypothetical protein